MRGKAQQLLMLLMVMVMLLAGCAGGGNRAAESLSGGALSVDELPASLGRGFPSGALIGRSGAASLEAGAMAPDFRMVLADGRSLTLSDLHGRPVLINFWATWCPPCRTEMPDIIERYNQYGDDLVVLAINTREGMDLVEPFTQQFGITMPVVLDQSGEIMRLYEVRSMPTSYFIGRDGQILMKWVGLMTPDILDSFLKIIL